MIETALVRAVLLSLLPGIFWLAYLRSLSRRRGVAPWLWLWSVGLGWLSTELTLGLSRGLQVDRLQAVPLVGTLVYFLFGVGLVEEFAKGFCAFAGIAVPRLGRDPLVTLQFSGAVALGFATTENVRYVLSFGEGVLVGRFLFSTLGHVLFAAVWGAALGARDGERPRWGLLLGSLLLSSLAHGLYDWFLTTDRMVLAVLTLAVLWFGFRQATLEAFLRQEYERELPYESRECPHCGVLTRAEGCFCGFCSRPLEGLEVESRTSAQLP